MKQPSPTWVVGTPVPPESRVGTVIEREYQVRSILSQGELGVTYQVFNTRLKSFFNVLILKRELAPTHEMMLAVKADMTRARELAPLGFMPMRLITDDQGIPGFATERLDGENLRQRLTRGPLKAAAALALVQQLAHALAAAHAVGLIHGDLRSENIFLVRPRAKGPYAGRVMVLEHSLRHLRRRPPGFDDTLPIGKLMYRPPEQVAGEVLTADVGGDIFVLGAILHECLTGRPAFYGEDVEGVLDRLSGPPALLRENAATGLSEGLTQQLNVVIAGCCSRDPQGRVPSMSDLHRALSQVISGADLALPATLCEEPPPPAALSAPPGGRVSRILQRLSGVFPTVGRAPEVVLQPPPVVKLAPPEAAAPAPAPVAAPEPVAASEPAAVSKPEAVATAAPAPDAVPVLAPAKTRAFGGGPRARQPRPALVVTNPLSALELPEEEEAAVVAATEPLLPRLTMPGLGQALEERPTRSMSRPPLIDQVRLVKERLTAGYAVVTEPPLAERPTRSLRARDITDLVAQVQQGKLAAAQAVEMAGVPEELGEADIIQEPTPLLPPAAAAPAAPLLPMPSAPSSAPRRPQTARQSLAVVPQRQPVAAAPLPPVGVPTPVPLPMAHSAPTRRAATRPGARSVTRLQASPLRRFLLQHQELVAAVLGAAVMLVVGLLLLWWR